MIRSKKLYEYLLTRGVLSLGPEAIAKAKREYRRIYKREHKKKRQKHELRPLFSREEYASISMRAKLCGMTATAYVRESIRAELTGTEIIPEQPVLLLVLQKISMARNQEAAPDLLADAESLLLQYLSHVRQDTDPAQPDL